MTNYQVGDFLIRLKNASMAGIKEVVFPKTKLVLGVAETLKREKFIESIEDESGNLKIKLSVFSKNVVLSDVKVISKPGLRVYKSVDDIESVKSPYILILSTPKGILSGREALKQRVGGELIAKVV